MTTVDPTSPLAPDRGEKLARARRRVAALKGFYIHLLVFVLVMGGLTIVNWATGRPWWVLWALFGWGIGVLAHGLAVSAHTSRAIANWEERKIKQLMREDR